MPWSCVRIANCPRRILLALLVVALVFTCASLAAAQAASPERIARAKHGVVLVTTYDDRGDPQVQGSGFFIARNQVVTNLHVINHAPDVRIKTYTGQTATVLAVVASDAVSDLALLQLDRACTDVAVFEAEYKLPIAGDPVTVISNPQGAPWKVTQGVVALTWEFADFGSRIQITATVLPGSSGGPVLNQQGHVVAVAVMHLNSDDDLNFAVPAARLKSLLTAPVARAFRL